MDPKRPFSLPPHTVEPSAAQAMHAWITYRNKLSRDVCKGCETAATFLTRDMKSVEETHKISRVSWKKMVHYVPQHVYFRSHVVSKATMAARMISKLIHGRPVAKVSPLKLSCCIWAEPTPMAQKQRLHASQSTNQATTEPDTHMCIPQILRAQGFQKTCWYHGFFL